MDIVEIIKTTDGAVVGKGASEQEISDAESELRLKFSNEYADYLRAFGSAMLNGHFLTGLSKAKQMNVVLVTNRERKFNEAVPNNLYVIENTGLDGIIIWQDEKGAIYSSSDSGIKKVCGSLAEYLKKYSV